MAKNPLADPLTMDAVRSAVSEQISAAGGTAEALSDDTLMVRFGWRTSTKLYLGNIYRSLRGQPVEAREAALGVYLERVVNPENDPEGLEARARLRLTIYHQDYISYAMDEIGRDAIVVWPIAGDIVAAVVIDYPTSVELATRDRFEDLGVEPEQGYALALLNTVALSDAVSIEGTPEAGYLLLDGYYENAMMLVPEVWDAVDARVDGRPVVASPSRGQIYFAGEHDSAALGRLADFAEVALTSEPGPISAALYVWTGDGWEVFPRP